MNWRRTGSCLLAAIIVAPSLIVAAAAPRGATTTVPATTGAPTTATTATASPASITLPSFGLTVPLPVGYARDVDTDKSAVMIVPVDRVGRAQERVVMVNVMPARGQRFERAVEEAVKTSGGLTVVRADARWGGLTATELALPGGPAGAAKSDKSRTLRSLMIERDDYFYLLGLVGTGDEADRGAFDEVAGGTKWGEIARAVESIASRQPPLTLPGGGFTFTLPDPFRPEPTKVKNAAVFVARDLTSHVVVARLTITLLRPPAPSKKGAPAPPAARTLADLKVEVDRTLAPQWRVKEPLRWSNATGKEIQSSISQPAGTPDGWVQGLVALTADGRRATVFSLQCRGGVANAGRLDQVLRIIRASVVGLPK